MATNNILTLTNDEFSQSSLVLFTKPVPSNQGLSINFDFYAYGGSGGDGISFILLDGSQSPVQPGGFGGSLGYAQRATEGDAAPGIAGGYLGIGFDEFGFFSAEAEGRVGGMGGQADSIAVRGSAATNYAFLTGTGSLQPFGISLDNIAPNANRNNSRRRAQVDLTPTGLLSVRVDFNGDNDFDDPRELAIDSFNVVNVNGALPSRFKFGFAASTGASTNVHEIGNFQVRTAAGTPIAGEFRDSLQVGGDSDDQLVGDNQDDVLTGGDGRDTSTGNGGADRFLFSGTTKAAALRTSTFRSLDQITDFTFSEGDRFQLDFDNNLSTRNLPRRLYNAGERRGNLRRAAQSAYADLLPNRRGNQSLKPNEAVFFRNGSRTYLSVNDDKAGFSPRNDLLVDVTGIQFFGRDAQRVGTLSRTRYFA
ncbi:hypothetical protein H6F67_04755 [Microcoleus sp. FACHB-1515]|uniref:bluetail domain-containing putative surface protein n=1 Tax=Cyanophyceae TaxID=3028117 RepID=UPI001684A31C|nr:bluetail domain-containing putative surface protein [Microcoleus sp. FACHB-1515]MBD2089162.1 hypothetical protein [Microcoleus sp. FACHB-1515]